VKDKRNKLDKFYTPKIVAKKCIDLTYAIFNNFSEIIEPSAGNGSFSLQIKDCIAYDIDPDHETIIKQDFLKLNLLYKKDRLVIGNPPFGERSNLTRTFYKKCIHICDYIGFILSIGFLNNIDSLYEFDLIKSIDLGILSYSNIKVHCCFNLYKRPKQLNRKPVYDKKVIIYDERQKNYANVNYDFAIYRRGSSVGKLRNKNLHTQTYKIYVKNRSEVENIKNKILSTDWLNYRLFPSIPYITKNDIYKMLNKN